MLNCPVKSALLITFYVFRSCFRTLAVILVSDFFVLRVAKVQTDSVIYFNEEEKKD